MSIIDIALPGVGAGDAVGLAALAPGELAEDKDAVDLVGRLARVDGDQQDPVRVAAFNSFI